MGGAYPVYCETPIPKAKRIRIGKLNNPAKRRVQYPAACYEMFPKLALGFIPVILLTAFSMVNVSLQVINWFHMSLISYDFVSSA